MGALTEEQSRFLASHGISEDEVLDGSDRSPYRYKLAMELEEKFFALVARPCPRGHSLRSHSGHCIQCDQSRIAYTRQRHAKSYIYIAGSQTAKVLKIGSSASPKDRAKYLNSRKYAEISDWELLFYNKYVEAEKVEFDVRRLLVSFAVQKSFGGRTEIDCQEVLACGYPVVRQALNLGLPAPGSNQWEHWSAISDRYRFLHYHRAGSVA
jgi:hypothetical protein